MLHINMNRRVAQRRALVNETPPRVQTRSETPIRESPMFRGESALEQAFQERREEERLFEEDDPVGALFRDPYPMRTQGKFEEHFNRVIREINTSVRTSASKAKEIINLLDTDIEIENPQQVFKKIEPSEAVMNVQENADAIHLLKIKLGQRIV